MYYTIGGINNFIISTPYSYSYVGRTQWRKKHLMYNYIRRRKSLEKVVLKHCTESNLPYTSTRVALRSIKEIIVDRPQE